MAAPMTELDFEKYFSELHVCISSKIELLLKIEELNNILCTLIQEITAANQGVRMKETGIADIESILEASGQKISAETCECVTNCYRLCRNLCAMCTDNQILLHNSGRFIELTYNLLLKCVHCDTKSDKILVLMRCVVQFLGNYSSGNKANQLQLWEKFSDVFRNLLLLEDGKLREYVLMVVHITLSDITTVTPAVLGDMELSLLCTCVQIASETDSQNGLLVTEDCLKIPGFCEKLYNQMSIQTRILVLEVLMNTLQRLPEDNQLPADTDTAQNGNIPSCNNLHYLAADFILQSHLIPSLTSASGDHLQVVCSVKELECLCIATAHHKLYGSLQENEQLVKTSVSLLQCIEEIGKQGNNVFTSVDKMSNLREVNTDHPVYGLKRDLIRLLGNMAYKHRHNQDLIRELDGLPLILDQTNIDGKNPFITQWSVFAIHNLTEENAENREYIANLKLQGVTNNQAILDEMGLYAETDGQKVVIKKKKNE